MTPKGKAKELVDKFAEHTTGWDYLIKAKQCALICVNEIIKANTNITGTVLNGEYWQQVKEKINKL